MGQVVGQFLDVVVVVYMFFYLVGIVEGDVVFGIGLDVYY